MYYEKLLRKEIMPIKLKAFLELCSYNKYNKKELYNLIYPLTDKIDMGNFNLIYNFATEMSLIEELSGGKVIYNKKSPIIMKENGLDEESYTKHMRELLFKSEKSLFFKITKELLSYDIKGIHYNKYEDIVSNLKIKTNVDQEHMLSYRFWAKYLGYAHNLIDDFLIINPYRYLGMLNKEIFKDGVLKISFKKYINALKSIDSVFDNINNGNEISEPVSIALKTLEQKGAIKLILENDAPDVWGFKKFTASEGIKVSHMEMGNDHE